MALNHYTHIGQRGFRRFVSDCGGAYAASMKLNVPIVFIDQILRDEPVPEHILDRIEKAVGPLRIRKVAFGSSSDIQGKPVNEPKADTQTAQYRLKELVSSSGGAYAASAKLDVPTFFIEQILRDEPVPDHILDQIEEAVGPLRIPRHDSGISNNGFREKQESLIEAETEPEVSFEDFVRSCGGIFAASAKLDLSTTTIKKILAGVPVSGPTINKVVKALKERDFSIALPHPNSHPSNHHKHPETSRLLESTAYLNGIYPSTIRKVERGQPVSKSNQTKLGISLTQTPLSSSDDSKTNSITAMSHRLKEIIKSDIDMFDVASNLGITELSLRKIYEGKPISSTLAKKVEAALGASNTIEPFKKSSNETERLRNIHALYEQLGTLAAVGQHLGLTRERVRQLLSKGKKIGLFDYSPREYAYVSKEKIIEDYKKTRSLCRVARLNNISTNYLDQLLTAYSITEHDLAEYRLEGRRSQCIEQFRKFADSLGHNPTTTEIQSTNYGKALYTRITRFWGSINNFRSELSIPGVRHIRPHWLDSWRQIALVKRMQHLDTVRDCLSLSSPVGVSEICEKSDFGVNRVKRLLALLMTTGEIKKVGQLANTKYLLTGN